MPPLLLQKVTDLHNENFVAVILVLIMVGLIDVTLHVMIPVPLLFYFVSLKINGFPLVIFQRKMYNLFILLFIGN